MITREIQKIFERSLVQDEEFLWTGKPSLAAFLRPKYPYIVTSLLFCLLVNCLSMMAGNGRHPDKMTIAASLLPLMIIVLQEIYIFFLWRSTFYAITNKGIRIRSGIPFPTISTIDFAKIKRLERESGIVSNNDRGTLLIRTAGNDDADLIGIQNPAPVYQLIQQELTRFRSFSQKESAAREYFPSAHVPRPLQPEKTQEFNNIKEAGEQIYWASKPSTVPFLLKDAAGIVFAIGWFLILLYYKIVFVKGPIPFRPAVIILLMLLSAPIWAALLYLVSHIFKSSSTSYAYTDRRLLVRNREKLEQVYYCDIGVIDVTVNSIEARSGTGTLRVYSHCVDKDQKRIASHFVAIKNPYDVCREIKQLMRMKKRGWQ